MGPPLPRRPTAIMAVLLLSLVALLQCVRAQQVACPALPPRPDSFVSVSNDAELYEAFTNSSVAGILITQDIKLGEARRPPFPSLPRARQHRPTLLACRCRVDLH
jgi:hypothetical protein